MPELLIETYGPVQVFEHTGGQYFARCTACGWRAMRYHPDNAKDQAADHQMVFH